MLWQSLKVVTQAMLQNRTRNLTYAKIAEEVMQYCPQDQQITAAWLEQFATDRIKAPSVDKVQVLYEYLSKQPLISA